MYDVTVIGAGVSGALIARELSKYNLKTIILEKDNDVSNGTTKANSAIIHAGYDAGYDTLKGVFNARGNKMFDRLCADLDVPFKRVGSMVVAFTNEELDTLGELLENGKRLDIPGLEIISASEVKEREPNLSNDIIGALYAPTAGIISPWELTIAGIENAMDNGVDLRLNFEVTSIQKLDDIFVVRSHDNEIKTRYIINCAGVYADKIYDMVDPGRFSIRPRRGQYYLLDKTAGNLINSVIFPCPTRLGKGVLLAPTVHGNILVGPDSEDIENKEGTITTDERLHFVRNSAGKVCKDIPFWEVITSFSGLRAEPSGGDFIIEESKEVKGFINVAGIKSPGLSAAPAIAEHVVDILKGSKGDLEENVDFKKSRRPVVRFEELTDEEKSNMIEMDSRYGRIICRCENITEGEIVDVIHRNCGGRTVDGIKRRIRPGMGRCQGGFCGPLVMEILARELGVSIGEIVKSNRESVIITGNTKELELYK